MKHIPYSLWLRIQQLNRKKHRHKEIRKSRPLQFSAAVFLVLVLVLVEAFGVTFTAYFCKQKAFQNRQQSLSDREAAASIEGDLKCFPVPVAYRNRVTYTDTYGASRFNGAHEGCDIMDAGNCSGEIPIVSATDGIITNIGWLYLGGYRIGITSEKGIYYYYAHLHSYAAGLEAGDRIQAGELLGFMGDTGEGEEGTSGKFPVHLHFSIYITVDSSNEQSVNPYPYLLNLQ